jgi:hypothetical protein
VLAWKTQISKSTTHSKTFSSCWNFFFDLNGRKMGLFFKIADL